MPLRSRGVVARPAHRFRLAEGVRPSHRRGRAGLSGEAFQPRAQRLLRPTLAQLHQGRTSAMYRLSDRLRSWSFRRARQPSFVLTRFRGRGSLVTLVRVRRPLRAGPGTFRDGSNSQQYSAGPALRCTLPTERRVQCFAFARGRPWAGLTFQYMTQPPITLLEIAVPQLGRFSVMEYRFHSVGRSSVDLREPSAGSGSDACDMG